MTDAADFRKIMGHYPTGVSVVTAMADEKPVGMVVGTFNSVSLDPPLVGFFPDKGSSTWPKIEAAGRFVVNILGSDQGALCRKLAASSDDKFDGVDVTLSPLGSPRLEGIIAGIDCELHDVIETGDHYLALGRVATMELYRDGDPLLFLKGAFGGFNDAKFL